MISPFLYIYFLKKLSILMIYEKKLHHLCTKAYTLLDHGKICGWESIEKGKG